MSIIPFIEKGEKRTVVTTEEEFKDAEQKGQHAILIRNFNASQYLEKGQPNCSYDLCVGEEYKNPQVGHSTHVEKCIKVPKHGVVILVAKEQVRFPKSRFGLIIAREKFLRKGLSCETTKIDPGYNGQLNITVRNHLKRPVTLDATDGFCALVVFDIASEYLQLVKPYDKEAKKIELKSIGWWPRTQEMFETLHPFLTILLLIATIISIVYQISNNAH
jgi:deoxycytidine triphosphate deaminase